MNTDHYYKILAVFAMILTVGTSNYLVQFPINDWLTLGAFTYPISYVITEIINRLYGSQTARQIVYIGFVLAVVLSMGMATIKIAIASGAAFLISQLLDILIFNQFRQYSWWVAPFSASCIASFVDTLVFWTVVCWGEEPLSFLIYAIGDFAVKMSLDLLLLIPFRLMTKKFTSIFIKHHSLLFHEVK